MIEVTESIAVAKEVPKGGVSDPLYKIRISGGGTRLR